MLTDFGKVCRKIRIDSDEILADMAEKLRVTSSFLSAIENGKKNVPEELCLKIKNLYNLDEKEYEKLLIAANNSQRQVKIQMDRLGNADRELVLSFARGFENLDAREKDKIIRILKG